MGKHLLDETAEFRMPALGRHAAGTDDTDEPEATQRFDPGFQRPRFLPAIKRHDDTGTR